MITLIDFAQGHDGLKKKKKIEELYIFEKKKDLIHFWHRGVCWKKIFGIFLDQAWSAARLVYTNPSPPGRMQASAAGTSSSSPTPRRVWETWYAHVTPVSATRFSSSSPVTDSLGMFLVACGVPKRSTGHTNMFKNYFIVLFSNWELAKYRYRSQPYWEKLRLFSKIFFLWISGSGCPATNFCKVSDFSEPIEPCWESNRTCQPDPGEAPIPRVGKGLTGFGIEHAPSREGVSALDHQATPAAYFRRWSNRIKRRCPQKYLESRVVNCREPYHPRFFFQWSMVSSLMAIRMIFWRFITTIPTLMILLQKAVSLRRKTHSKPFFSSRIHLSFWHCLQHCTRIQPMSKWLFRVYYSQKPTCFTSCILFPKKQTPENRWQKCSITIVIFELSTEINGNDRKITLQYNCPEKNRPIFTALLGSDTWFKKRFPVRLEVVTDCCRAKKE